MQNSQFPVTIVPVWYTADSKYRVTMNAGKPRELTPAEIREGKVEYRAYNKPHKVEYRLSHGPRATGFLSVPIVHTKTRVTLDIREPLESLGIATERTREGKQP